MSQLSILSFLMQISAIIEVLFTEDLTIGTISRIHHPTILNNYVCFHKNLTFNVTNLITCLVNNSLISCNTVIHSINIRNTEEAV